MNSSLFVITEIGVLPNGAIGNPFPGETLAGVSGKLALIAVAGDR